MEVSSFYRGVSAKVERVSSPAWGCEAAERSVPEASHNIPLSVIQLEGLQRAERESFLSSFGSSDVLGLVGIPFEISTNFHMLGV